MPARTNGCSSAHAQACRGRTRRRLLSFRLPCIAVADAVRAKCSEPRPRLEPGRAAIRRPEGAARPAYQILCRHHANAPVKRRKAAVEAVVAVVAHQKYSSSGDFRLGEVVGRAMIDLIEHCVASAAGKRFEICAIETR